MRCFCFCCMIKVFCAFCSTERKCATICFAFFLFSSFSFFHNHKTFFPFSLNISSFSSFAFSFYKHLDSPLGSPYLTLSFALSPSLSFTMFLISALLFFSSHFSFCSDLSISFFLYLSHSLSLQLSFS